MKTKRPSQMRERATLVDRFAVAFLSGLTAFITGLVVSIILAIKNVGVISVEIFLSNGLYWFMGIMALIGFLLLENLIARVYGLLWRGIGYLFSPY